MKGWPKVALCSLPLPFPLSFIPSPPLFSPLNPNLASAQCHMRRHYTKRKFQSEKLVSVTE